MSIDPSSVHIINRLHYESYAARLQSVPMIFPELGHRSIPKTSSSVDIIGSSTRYVNFQMSINPNIVDLTKCCHDWQPYASGIDLKLWICSTAPKLWRNIGSHFPMHPKTGYAHLQSYTNAISPTQPALDSDVDSALYQWTDRIQKEERNGFTPVIVFEIVG